MENLASERGLDLKLTGNLPNERLPQILREHQIFAITSSWEGHPKALIEAMACGMPCIGVDGTGIRNFIEHGKNGWLVKATHDSLVKGISELLENDELCVKLSKDARAFVIKHYGFKECFSKEYKLMSSFIGERQ